MVTAAPNPASHPVQLGGRVVAFLVFLACTLVGVRHFLLEPRRSPLDAIIWTALVLMGAYLCVVTVAALVNLPLLGRSVALDTRMRLVPTILVIGLCLASLALAIPYGRWLTAAANSLIIAASLYNVHFLRRQASGPPPSQAGPGADDAGAPA